MTTLNYGNPQNFILRGTNWESPVMIPDPLLSFVPRPRQLVPSGPYWCKADAEGETIYLSCVVDSEWIRFDGEVKT